MFRPSGGRDHTGRLVHPLKQQRQQTELWRIVLQCQHVSSALHFQNMIMISHSPKNKACQQIMRVRTFGIYGGWWYTRNENVARSPWFNTRTAWAPTKATGYWKYDQRTLHWQNQHPEESFQWIWPNYHIHQPGFPWSKVISLPQLPFGRPGRARSL